MRRAVVLALVLASSAATADKAEDPKAAIAARGVVLKAGKRNYIIIVPPAERPKDAHSEARIQGSRVFYGNTKGLTEQLIGDGIWITTAGNEELVVPDPRGLFGGKLRRSDESFAMVCDVAGEPDERAVALSPVTDAKIVATLARAPVKPLPMPRVPLLLARLDGTSYLLLDRVGHDGVTDPRIYLGKRGALKQLAIKELANDSEAIVVVTAKGTLTMTKAKSRNTEPTATFEVGKKSSKVTVIPVVPNRKLIHLELGVYSKQKTGYPCDDL